MTKPHFSSLRMDWKTPKAVYQDWNYRICELAITLSKFKNVTCVIWSGGGKDYAERVMREFNTHFGKTFKSAHSKLEPINPDIAIDDVQACELGKLNLIVREK